MPRSKNEFYAVILSGGSGERFWPISTQSHPKQFLSIFGGKSLLRQCFERLEGLITPEKIIVVTSKKLCSATRKELPEIPRKNIILEPCRRDTAAAIATACTEVAKRGGNDAIAAVLPADHLITDVTAFRRLLCVAAEAAAESASIVTLGVKPVRPATGFGYIKVGRPRGKVLEAKHFVEKPDLATAKRYLKSGCYVWNAGMFVWKVATMKDALAKYAPQLLGITVKDYENLPRISFDYAVMEKIDNVLVTSGDFGWDDVGTWSSVECHLEKDVDKNVVRGDTMLLDCTDVTAVGEGMKIAAFGVDNLVIAATKKAVLVVSKKRAEDLKMLVAKVESAKVK